MKPRITVTNVQKEFALEDGPVTTLPRQPEKTFLAVGGEPGGHAAPPMEVLVRLLGQAGALGLAQLRAHLVLKDRAHLRERYLDPALTEGLVEATIPGKPTSRHQQYRLTAKGTALLASLRKSSRASSAP